MPSLSVAVPRKASTAVPPSFRLPSNQPTCTCAHTRIGSGAQLREIHLGGDPLHRLPHVLVRRSYEPFATSVRMGYVKQASMSWRP